MLGCRGRFKKCGDWRRLKGDGRGEREEGSGEDAKSDTREGKEWMTKEGGHEEMNILIPLSRLQNQFMRPYPPRSILF